MDRAKRNVLGAALSAAFALALGFGAREALAAPAAGTAAAACYPEQCEWFCNQKGYPAGYCNGGTSGSCVCVRF